MPEPAVKRGDGHRPQIQLRTGPHWLHVKADNRRDQGDARLPGQRRVEARQSAQRWGDQQVRRMRSAQEARVGGGGPPRPRGRGQHRAARHGDQQGERCPGPPAGPELVPGEAQHHPHLGYPPRGQPPAPWPMSRSLGMIGEVF